jgi:hypothetical protein
MNTQKAYKVAETTGKKAYQIFDKDIKPKVCEVEKKLEPKVRRFEHKVLGDPLADVIDETIEDAIEVGKEIGKVAEKAAPVIVATGKAAYETSKFAVVTTGKVIDAGVQTYQVVDRELPKAIKTTFNYFDSLNTGVGTILYAADEGFPKIVETGGRVAKTIDKKVIPELVKSSRGVAKSVEEVGKTLGEAVPELKDGVDAAGRKLAALQDDPDFGKNLAKAGGATIAAAAVVNLVEDAADSGGGGFNQPVQRRRRFN